MPSSDKPRKTKTDAGSESISIADLLIRAALWMLFGFMIWFYLSAWHVQPAMETAEWLLEKLLGEDLHSIIQQEGARYQLLVQTRIEHLYPDGDRAPLGFLINPLIYSYGLPMLFGLTMAVDTSFLRQLLVLLTGTVAVFLVQVWGIVWRTLSDLSFVFGGAARQAVEAHGLSPDLIALCNQLGNLILPTLVPVMVWVFGNWALVDRLAGSRGRPNR